MTANAKELRKAVRGFHREKLHKDLDVALGSTKLIRVAAISTVSELASLARQRRREKRQAKKGSAVTGRGSRARPGGRTPSSSAGLCGGWNHSSPKVCIVRYRSFL